MSILDKTHLPPGPWAVLFSSSPHSCILYHHTNFSSNKCCCFYSSASSEPPSTGRPASGPGLEVWWGHWRSQLGKFDQSFDIRSPAPSPLFFFRASERQAALMEAGLINSEINEEGCSYASLQMCRRCIDRRRGVRYLYPHLFPLSFPK